jgi:hypothetical protein
MRLLVPPLLFLPMNGAYAQAPAETVKEQFAKRAERLWSLQPVTKPAVPAGVTKSTNPIDAFIAADYNDKGLLPAAKADKLTLLRRVYLDLIGLPPTPAEQEAFLADSSPDAYEKVVDRLLDNEQHGVRWSRYWLDVLRYADLMAWTPVCPPRPLSLRQRSTIMPYDRVARNSGIARPEVARRRSGRMRHVEARRSSPRLPRSFRRYPQRSIATFRSPQWKRFLPLSWA